MRALRAKLEKDGVRRIFTVAETEHGFIVQLATRDKTGEAFTTEFGITLDGLRMLMDIGQAALMEFGGDDGRTKQN